jgi:hypothetical protein
MNQQREKMNSRERTRAILSYEEYDRLPIVHFGFWCETLEKWHDEGHITDEDMASVPKRSGDPINSPIEKKLGFDFNWNNCFRPRTFVDPPFEEKVIKEHPDGSQEVMNGLGVTEIRKPGLRSIPAEIDHLLKDRASWEEHYKRRFVFSETRITSASVYDGEKNVRFDDGGLEWILSGNRDIPYGLHLGSLFGDIRNMLGIEGVSYLYMDDEELYTEIIDVVGELSYKCTEYVLSKVDNFDFAHFWEDICFKSGPLVVPQVFDEKVGPHYKRITDLVRKHGIDNISLDCDGLIDALIPTWLNNGVNVMFPIEVGTWHASIKPWQEKYGKNLKGIGGMDKKVFALDYAAIDEEVERLKPLVELGGYIPCPDHRIPPGAKWENVQYYCQQMRKTFG